MIPLEYISEILSNYNFLYTYLITLLSIFIFNKLIFNKVINGLYLLNFTSSIVFAVIIDLYVKNYITTQKLFFFAISEVFLFIVVVLIYKQLIKNANREKLRLALHIFNNKYFILLIVFLLLSVAMNAINVVNDGSSRIAFNVNKWYSIIRVINTLLRPTIAMILFFNIESKNKVKSVVIFLLLVLESVTAGSRAGFLFFLIGYYLVYVDIFDAKVFVKKSSKYLAFLTLTVFAIFTLMYNNLSVLHTFERLVHYGESTIMVYPLNEPTSVVNGHSMISKIHRGFGRLFGDSTSNDIDTLFGYALSAKFYGANTLTGPNARIGSYALTVFPGGKILLLYLIFFGYLRFCFHLLKSSRNISPEYYIISLLLILDGIQQFIFDYNTGMSILTVIIILLVSRMTKVFLVHR